MRDLRLATLAWSVCGLAEDGMRGLDQEASLLGGFLWGCGDG